MNRRSFLTRLGIGLVGVGVTLAVPTRALKAMGLAEPARLRAIDRLMATYLAHWNHHPRSCRPRAMVVGQDLYDAYVQELPPTWRFVSTDPAFKMNALFKGIPLSPVLRGWGSAVVCDAPARADVVPLTP